MTVAPRVPDHEQRDAHLLAALQHAPDRDMLPPAALSAQILDSARQAVQPARPAAPARSWKAAWLERLLQWQRLLAQPATAGALATLAVATVIGLMWRSGVPADEETQFAVAQVAAPEAPAPPPAMAPATQVAPQAPAALAKAAPAPAADAAAPAKAEQAPPQIERHEITGRSVRREPAVRRVESAPPPVSSRSRSADESPPARQDAGAAAFAAAASAPGAELGRHRADEAVVAAAPVPAPPAAVAPATSDLSADPWTGLAAVLQERPGVVGLSAPPGSPATPPLAAEDAPLSSARRAAAAERAGPPELQASRASDPAAFLVPPLSADTAADTAADWLRRVQAATQGRWQPVGADALSGVNLQAARTVLIDGEPHGRLLLQGRSVLWLPQASPAQAWRADLDASTLRTLRARMPGGR